MNNNLDSSNYHKLFIVGFFRKIITFKNKILAFWAIYRHLKCFNFLIFFDLCMLTFFYKQLNSNSTTFKMPFMGILLVEIAMKFNF